MHIRTVYYYTEAGGDLKPGYAISKDALEKLEECTILDRYYKPVVAYGVDLNLDAKMEFSFPDPITVNKPVQVSSCRKLETF